MASVAGNGQSVTGRIDRAGRLVQADGLLADLQVEAGSAVGDRIALPQLAAIARLVRKLGIAIARPAMVAGRDHDLDLWVRGEPSGDDVVLTIESWHRRTPLGPRLELAARNDDALPVVESEWATDAELRITELSADLATMAGTSAGEAIGQPLTKWFRLVEGEDGAMPLLTALATRTSFSGQPAALRSGPGHRLVLNGEPVLGGDGHFAGFRGRALAESPPTPTPANEGGASPIAIDPALDHTLRSPLDRIIAAAQGIADRSEGPLRSDYAAYADDIASAARHLLSVIRSMVHQPQEDDELAVDLGKLVDEAVGLVEARAEELEVAVERDGEPALAALGDARSIVQVLVNLIGNAVRHSPAGSTVTIRLDRTGDNALVTVIDQGSGIAVGDQERIFHRFEQAGGGGGAGLGLTIARRLARTMGGDVTLDSRPGEGARFSLRLPLA